MAKQQDRTQYVWEAEFIEWRKTLDGPVFARDTFTATSFGEAVRRAETEALAAAVRALAPSPGREWTWIESTTRDQRNGEVSEVLIVNGPSYTQRASCRA